MVQVIPPKKLDTENISRFEKISQSVSNTMRTIKISTKERATIAQRFVNPLPLQTLGYAQIGRSLGRLGSVLVDPSRVYMSQRILFQTEKGRLLFLEGLKNNIKIAVAEKVGSGREEINKIIDIRFNELASKINEAGTSTKFLAMVNKTVNELSKELGIKNLPSIAKSLTISQLLNMHTFRSGGKIAILDPSINKAIVIDKNSNTVKDIKVSEEEINNALKSKGIDPEKAPMNMKELTALRNLLDKIRENGFKVKESAFVDIREKALVGKALAKSMTTDKNLYKVYSQLLEEDLKADSEFNKEFQEKASKEIIKSLNASSLANTMMDSFTKLPSKFTAMFARLIASISRYIPLVGPIVSVGSEASVMYMEYGETLSEKVKSLPYNSIWSLKDLVSDESKNNSIPNNVSLQTQSS
ncbi:MAG: hypothetical protein QW456_06395 [Ignisphaera sp.]